MDKVKAKACVLFQEHFVPEFVRGGKLAPRRGRASRLQQREWANVQIENKALLSSSVFTEADGVRR